MFVTWAMLNGLAGSIHTDDFPEDLSRLRNRELTPGAWFIEACDEKFTDEDLNDEGNAFAQVYYANDDGLITGKANFLDDYADALPGHDVELYRVSDSWMTFETISPKISERFEEWRNPKKGWRRFFS